VRTKFFPAHPGPDCSLIPRNDLWQAGFLGLLFAGEKKSLNQSFILEMPDLRGLFMHSGGGLYGGDLGR